METSSMSRAREAVTVRKPDFTIHHLPDDCLFHIFSFLPVEDLLRSTAVCKRWRDFKSESWRGVKKLDLVALEKLENPRSFVYISFKHSSRCNYCELERYAEDYSGQEEARMYRRFTTKYPRLLALGGGSVNVLTMPVARKFDTIRIAADNCANLTKICVRFETTLDTAKYCIDLGRLFTRNVRTLRSVIIDNMDEKFAKYAKCLLRLPEELTELQLWGYKAHYTRFAEIKMVKGFGLFIPAIQRLKKLRILVLNGLQILANELQMISSFEDLKYLEILSSTLDNRPLTFDVKAISCLHNLEYLALQQVDSLNQVWLTDFIRNNANLKHLKLQACTLHPNFVTQLSALVKLETLNLSYLTLRYKFVDWSGFRNLRKFVSTTVGDNTVDELLEIAPNLKLMILCNCRKISSRVLDKGQEVADKRINDVSLHIVVDDEVLWHWRKPPHASPLFIVERTWDYNRRTRYGYEGNDEEIFYWSGTDDEFLRAVSDLGRRLLDKL